jgi:hypothetical protein
MQTPPFTSHLSCAVEQLACGPARWQSSSRLGLAFDVSPIRNPMDRWTEPPINSFRAHEKAAGPGTLASIAMQITS